MKYDTAHACYTSECVPCYTERKKNERDNRASRSPLVSPVKMGTTTEPSTLEILKVEISNLKDILTQQTVSQTRLLQTQYDCYMRCNREFANIATQYFESKQITELEDKVNVLRYFSENTCKIVKLRGANLGKLQLNINGKRGTRHDTLLDCYLSVNL